MKRLSTQIYLVIILSLVLVVVVSALFWRRGPDRGPVRQAFEVAGELASVALAPASAPEDEQKQALDRLAERLKLNLTLYGADRQPIVKRGPLLPAPPLDREESGWIYGRGGPAWAIEMPDGRWLVARGKRRDHGHPALNVIAFLGAISLLVALSTWPVVRGLTRRLEKLQQAVDKVGSGDLNARVPVEGRDEVAKLALSFNRSTARIEELVGAHKMLLANASHELRTPLSRIRLGLELLDGSADPARKAALEKDIAEVDQLITEILLASRLDALEQLDSLEEVDLLALAAEEGARFDECTVDGEPALIKGDPRLLRRLVRNLIENANRHGAPPIEVDVRPDRAAGMLRLTVSDGGTGIPVSERLRVFEPFRRGRAAEPTAQRDGGGARGSGLGLTLVRQIARRHGGDAVIDGPPGTSRFVVTLPLPAATTGLARS